MEIHPKTWKLIAAAVLALAVGVLPATQVVADDTWDNTTGNELWSSATNWLDDTEPTAADAVTFPAAIPNVDTIITLSSGEVALSLSLENNYTLTGGNLTLGTGGNISAANGVSAVVTSTLIGSNGLTKLGDGRVKLAKNNTFTGNIAINGGTLELSTNFGDDTELGNTANDVTIDGATIAGFFTANAGRTFTIGAGGATFEASGAIVMNNVTIGGTGALTKTGSSGGRLELKNTNTFVGNVTINAGTIEIDRDSSLGDAANDVILDGGKLKVSGVSGTLSTARDFVLNSGGGTIENALGGTLAISGEISGTGSLTMGTFGTLLLSGPNTYTGSTNTGATGATIKLGANNAVPSSSAVTLRPNSTFDLNNFDDTIGSLAGQGFISDGSVLLGSGDLTTGADDTSTTYKGVISGSGSVTKVGTGTFTMGASNSYTGGTNVNAGTLALGVNSVLDNTGAVTVSGGTFDIAAFSDTVDAVTLTSGSITGTTGILTGASYAVESGTITARLAGSGRVLTKSTGGTVTLSGANTYTGGTTINAGTLSVSADNNLGGTGTATFGGGTLNTTATFSTSRNMTLNSGGGTISPDGGTILTATGVISGVGSLTKLGAGTLVLTNNNTYTGTSFVSAGTLRLDGSLGTGTIINGTGTIKGTGTAGPVTVDNGGTIAPGNSIGVINAGSTDFNSGGTYEWEIADANGPAGTGYDLLNVTGVLNINSSSTNEFIIDVVAGVVNNWSPALGWSWVIATASGGISNFAADKFEIVFTTPFSPTETGNFTIEQSGNGNNLLLVFAVPEPTGIWLLALASTSLARRRRRLK